MSNCKENFEDYQEGGAKMSDMSKFMFGKKKPPPAPTPPPDPYAGVLFQERPTDAARRQAEEEARRKAQEERERAEAERRKKYGPGPLSSTAMGRGTVDFARAVAAKTTTAAVASSKFAKNTVASVISKPQLRDMNSDEADLFNDNNIPITPTDFSTTYNNLMEEIRNIDNLTDMQKGEKVLKELKILRSLAGESFTNTEKCITEIFDKLASFNEQVLLGRFDINTRDTLKNEMHAISDKHFNNDTTIIRLIMDYVDKNRTTINDLFINMPSGIAVKRFYMGMLIIIFYPKIILNMISDKMIDSILAIKEKRDDLLADGDDNINSIIERLLGKSSYDYNYDSLPGLSRGVSWKTGTSDSEASSRSDYTLGSDNRARLPSLVTTPMGGAPPISEIFRRAMKAPSSVDPAVAPDPAVAVAAPAVAVAAPADPAAPAGADGAGADGAGADGAGADGDDGHGDDGADGAGADGAGADGDGDLSSRLANPLISFLNSDNPYMKQSGLIFYNALTNFAVSIGIYKRDYKNEIAKILVKLIKTKFNIIDPYKQAGTDYTNLRVSAQKTFDDAISALRNLSDGRDYIDNEERIEGLKEEYDKEENKLIANTSLSNDSDFMKKYNASKDSLNEAIHNLSVTRYKIETSPLPQFRDSVVDYLNAKLKLDIASKKPDIQREISTALFVLLDLADRSVADRSEYEIYMNNIYFNLIIPGNVDGNYPLALNKYITSGIGKSIMFQFNVPKSVAVAEAKPKSLISRILPLSRKGGKRGTRRYKKRAGTRRQKKHRGTHRKRKNTTK
jgi:hypothetical protein